MSKRSEAQIWLEDYLRERYGELVAAEHMFHPTRKWRFDAAVQSCKFAFEIEGVGRTQDGKFGRHQTIGGFIADMEKYNAAAALGWKVFRFTTQQVLKGAAKKFIEENL